VPAWAQFLGRVQWERFASLTFDPKRSFPITRELASRETFMWCNYLAYAFRQPVGWAYVVELGRAGSWHAHALIIGTRRRSWSAPQGTWKLRNGDVDLRRVHDVEGVSLYSSKTAADGGEVVLSDTIGRYVATVGFCQEVNLYPVATTDVI